LAVPAPPDKPRQPPPEAKRWTVKDVLLWTTSRFEERGLDTPRLDAEILTAHALGMPRVQLYVQFDRPLLPEELTAIRESVKRRQAGESVAYVVGKKEFWGLELAVDARVLVPRPDTETLVGEALDRIGRAPRARPRRLADAALVPPDATSDDPPRVADADPAPTPPSRPAPRIADVGTGSGAIAIALAKERPDATVFAVDVSPDALAVARANAERHGVTVTFLEGDLAAPLAPHAPFDLIVANLPYVAAGDLADLAPEVRAEPVLALDGGPDGLALVRRLVAAAPARLCGAAGLADVRVVRDLGQIERVVSAVRP
jgi:release factor glutamine methyltransferase